MDLGLFFETVENIPVGIFILDAAGNYLYVNQEYCNTVYKTKEFFQNMNIFKLKELGYITTNVWEQVMESKQKVVSVISIVDKHLNLVYDSLTTGVPLFDNKGEIEYIIYHQERVDRLYEYARKGVLNKHLFRNEELSVTPKDEIISESDDMKRLLDTVDKVAKTDASVLVTGPSGAGKEIIAKRIHQLSEYNQGPLVFLNCAALPESIMESELFGYEKGAFTGAVGSGKKGLIETANSGTLFLDEINSMPLAVQAKLLRVLESKQVTRLGAVKAKSIQFRLVCASNEDMYDLVMSNRFRADLFYRINVISIDIPPLCQRKEDIKPLAEHFLEHYCRKYNCFKVLSSNVINIMNDYDWPGNVRELRNFMERIVILSPDSGLELASIPAGSFVEVTADTRAQTTKAITKEDNIFEQSFSLRVYMEQCEKEILIRALDKFESPKNAAKALGIDLSNVYRKMQKFGIQANTR